MAGILLMQSDGAIPDAMVPVRSASRAQNKGQEPSPMGESFGQLLKQELNTGQLFTVPPPSQQLSFDFGGEEAPSQPAPPVDSDRDEETAENFGAIFPGEMTHFVLSALVKSGEQFQKMEEGSRIVSTSEVENWVFAARNQQEFSGQLIQWNRENAEQAEQADKPVKVTPLLLGEMDTENTLRYRLFPAVRLEDRAGEQHILVAQRSEPLSTVLLTQRPQQPSGDAVAFLQGPLPEQQANFQNDAAVRDVNLLFQKLNGEILPIAADAAEIASAAAQIPILGGGEAAQVLERIRNLLAYWRNALQTTADAQLDASRPQREVQNATLTESGRPELQSRLSQELQPKKLRKEADEFKALETNDRGAAGKDFQIEKNAEAKNPIPASKNGGQANADSRKESALPAMKSETKSSGNSGAPETQHRSTFVSHSNGVSRPATGAAGHPHVPNAAAAARVHRVQAFHERQSLFSQIQKQIRGGLRTGTSQLRLRLKPESLGQMMLRLEMAGGKMQAQFWVETAQVKRTLETGLDHLRQALEEKGIHPELIEVKLGAPAAATMKEPPSGQPAWNEEGSNTSGQERSSENSGRRNRNSKERDFQEYM